MAKRIDLSPENFGTIEARDLEGRFCDRCGGGFDTEDRDWEGGDFAYVAKIDGLWIEKGDIYHAECVEELLELENTGRI